VEPVRYAGALVALVVLAGSVVLSVSRPLRSDQQLWVLAASFVPWAIPGYALALLVLLLVRRGSTGAFRQVVGVAAALCVLGVAVHAAWLVPAYAGKHVTGPSDLTVMGLNLRRGTADTAATARLVEREAPQVIVLSEATPQAVRALADLGIGGRGSRWPYLGGRPRSGILGTAVLSAYPLSGQHRIDIDTGAYRMRVGAPTPFWLTGVHTTQPLYSTALWNRDFDLLVADAPQVQGPRMEIGDFNATLDHSRMRDLLGTGLHDAAAEANSGWQPTWPSPGSRRMAGLPVPIRLMALDHVLLSEQFSAVSTSVHVVPGTDHEALVAHLLLPKTG
jgi:endonuclease/exonuclease/phosphatase (EEP) superfamily protein YafD